MKKTPLRRKSPLSAKRGLSRGTTRLERRTRLKSKRPKPQGPFQEWIRKNLLCAACGAKGPDGDHVKTRGAGGKDAFNVWPLCRVCHTLRHSEGILTFQARRGLNAKEIAIDVWKRWRKYENP